MILSFISKFIFMTCKNIIKLQILEISKNPGFQNSKLTIFLD